MEEVLTFEQGGIVFVLTLQDALNCLWLAAVQNLAAKTPGKESMAMEAFAKALRQVRL